MSNKRSLSAVHRGAPLGSLERKEMKAAYIMLAPGFALLCAFVLYPLAQSVYRSLYEWTFYTKPSFIGLSNYKIVLQDYIFIESLGNIIKFVVIQVPLAIFLAFMFAMLLKMIDSKLVNLIKSAIYVPGIVSGVIASSIVLIMINYQSGLLNQLIVALGGKKVAVTRSAFWSYAAIIFTNIWLGIGGNTILMYAGLMGIPQEYYEAASMDGANALNKFMYITVPQMKNLLILQLVNHTASGLQMFDMPNFITGGGPRNTTMTPMLYVYSLYKDPTKSLGYMISSAVIMMCVIAMINSVVFALIRSEKMMEG